MRNQTLTLSWMKQSLDSYLLQLSLNMAEPTILAYKYDVSKFLEYLADRNIKRIASIKTVHVTDYLGFCKSQGKSDASINRYYMAIRSYCQFLRKTKLIAFDLTEDVSAPRAIQKAPKILTRDQVRSMIELPDVETEKGCRDKAILELLYSSGLRVTELCDLDLEDFNKGSIQVKCGKRGKTRTVPMTDEAIKAVQSYVDQYREDGEGALFLTTLGKRINRQRMSEMVGMYARIVGVKGITAHSLRHACATHFLDAGADIRFIQEVLGHSSIGSTQRYTHLSSNKMKDMFKQFHPRQNKEG